MPSYSPVPHKHGQFLKSEINGILECLAEVLETSAKLRCRHIGMPAEGPASLPLEFSVRYYGQSSIYLNVRTTMELAQLLEASIQDGAMKPGKREETFKEFVNAFGGRLTAYLWGSVGGNSSPDIPSLSTPQSWPAREPTACCAFIVENWPLEVRLWMGEKK